MNRYSIQAQATNPHGGQVSWYDYDVITPDKEWAERECATLNRCNPTENVNGTVWDILWVVVERELA